MLSADTLLWVKQHADILASIRSLSSDIDWASYTLEAKFADLRPLQPFEDGMPGQSAVSGS